MKPKKKKKKVRSKDLVADQALVDKYVANIIKYGRDWHIIRPKRAAKLLKKGGFEPKDITDHLVRRADIQFDRQMREQTRKWNIDPARRRDLLVMLWNGSNCLEEGETLGYVVEKPKIVEKKGPVQQALTNKWQSSDRISRVSEVHKPIVIRVLKKLVAKGVATKRKKDDGTFQYKLKGKA